MKRGIKLSLIISIILSVIGIVFGGLTYGFTFRTVIVYGLIGTFLGAIAAPEFEPKYFQHPIIWQVVSSTIGCLLFAYGIQAPSEGYILALLVGGFLGYTANYWVKHVVFP